MASRQRIVCIGFGLLVLAAPIVALPSTVQIALDTDGVATGGCTLTTVDGPFAGAEQLLTVSIETANATAVVEGIERQECVAGVFGSPVVVDPGSWPVGISLGVNGSHVVEAYVPLADLGPQVASVRFGIVHVAGADEDALLLTQPTTGLPIVLVLRSVLEIPTISQWGLLVLLMLLAWLALRRLRRHEITIAVMLIATVAVSGWAWAVCVMDGLIDDWSAADSLALDASDDAADAVDLQAFSAKADGADLCLRVDTDLAFDQPPVANDDAFEVAEGSVDNSLDVLANDLDPEGMPLSITVVGSADQGGSASTDGLTVLYSPAPTFVGVETFSYTIADGAGGTDGALVTVTVTARCGNGIQEVLPQSSALCSGLLYGATTPGPAQPSDLYTIDPATGVGTLVGTIDAGGPSLVRVSAMDFDPDGLLHGIGVLSNQLVLLRIDCTTAGATVIGQLGLSAAAGSSVTDMSFDSLGRLWVHYRDTSSSDELGTVDRLTGAYTAVGNTTLADIGNGLASGGFPSTILYHAGSQDLSSLDPLSGNATFVADLAFPPEADDLPRINGMDVDFASGSAFVSLNDTPTGIGALPQSFLATLDLGTGAVSLLTEPPQDAPDSLDAIAVNRVYETCDDGSVLPPGASCGASCRLVEDQCADAVDNDFDGLVDCQDPDCDLRPCDDQEICTTNDTCRLSVCLGEAVPSCGAILGAAPGDAALPLVAAECADVSTLLDLAGR